jgi:osmotically-inducible protein OsmY
MFGTGVYAYGMRSTPDTQIAAAAPNSNVNVTSSNGVVALAGSVPNQ